MECDEVHEREPQKMREVDQLIIHTWDVLLDLVLWVLNSNKYGSMVSRAQCVFAVIILPAV